MGQVERNKEEKQANKRDKQRTARRGRATEGKRIDVAHANWVELAALVVGLSEEGGALRIGLTRDGGAWALGVYCGEDYATEYIRPQENFAEAVAEIAEAWLADKGAAYYAVLNEYNRTGGVQTALP